MQRLIEGVPRFQRATFGNSRELLNPPAPNGQQRPVLLITCADAGLLTERISLNRPDGFHCATGLGTFIPPASTTDGNDSDSIVTTIEYAVRVLRVSDIVVCGHSPCGAMATLVRGTLASNAQKLPRHRPFPVRVFASSVRHQPRSSNVATHGSTRR